METKCLVITVRQHTALRCARNHWITHQTNPGKGESMPSERGQPVSLNKQGRWDPVPARGGGRRNWS